MISPPALDRAPSGCILAMKSDPLSKVYEAGHEEFFKANQMDIMIDAVKKLADIPYRTITYSKNS